MTFPFCWNNLLFSWHTLYKYFIYISFSSIWSAMNYPCSSQRPKHNVVMKLAVCTTKPFHFSPEHTARLRFFRFSCSFQILHAWSFILHLLLFGSEFRESGGLRPLEWRSQVMERVWVSEWLCTAGPPATPTNLHWK